MNRFLLVSLLIAACTAGLVSAESRTYLGDRAAVTINGAVYAGLLGWSGGEPRGIVQTNGNKKQIGKVVYDPVVLEVSGVLQAPLAGVVADFCAGAPAPVALLLHATNSPTLEASNAVLTKVEFPALDGASKESTRIILTFEVSSTRALAGPAVAIPLGAKGKAALASNFRLTVEGLPSNRIATVSSLVISRESGKLEVSNLLISISSADAEAWTQWRDRFLLQGKNSDAQEKSATLSLLDPAMKNPLVTLSLSQVGLVRLSRSVGDGERVSRIEAELYVESVSVAPVTL
ncbi:MAG TPA: hypothetical protein PLN52_07065 [Opitutaceae bacterium]|nr:hypothetical protein [Opitutaceae bacterium]